MLTPAQRRNQRKRRLRREKRHHYKSRLLFFSLILLLAALGCVYVNTVCEPTMSSYNHSKSTIKQDWQYEIELEKSEIMKYSMQ